MADTFRATDHDMPLAADQIGDVKWLKTKVAFGDNDSATEVSNTNPLPVNIGSATVTLSSGSFNITFASGTFALLSGNTSIYTASGAVGYNNPFPIGGIVGLNSGEVHVMSGQINAVVNSGNINAVVNSGNINAFVTSGNVTASINSGNINAVINSGNINAVINSGNINAVVNSGNITAFVNSGNIRVLSGNITLLNSGSNVGPTNPLPVTIASGSIGGNGIPISLDPSLIDAFNRIRVSNPFTVFDSQQRYQQSDKWNYTTTTGGSTSYDTNGSLLNYRTSLASGAEVIGETYKVMPYQPGKSLFIMQSCYFGAAQANHRQRTGYFGAQNGVYFEQDGTDYNFVLRSYISGSVVETRKLKGTWNYDNLDGTGPSGINISNFNSSFLMWVDIEWLGVGDVKVGFVLNGKLIICHIFKNTPAGGFPISGTYMTTACLPLRYEITNTGTVTTSGNLKQICSTVISEGGYTGFQRSYNASLRTAERNLVNENVLYPVISIRLASGRLDSIVLPASVSSIVTSNQNILYRLISNGTLSSGTSWVTHSNGNVQIDTSSTYLASGSGNDIVGGYIATQGQIEVAGLNDFEFQLGRTLGGVSDTLTLAMAGTSPNTKVLADLGWYEVI